jgi:hypothetical protein
MDLLISDMLKRHEDAIAGTTDPPIAASGEPYVAMHLRLAETWPSQLAHLSTDRSLVAVIGSFLLVCVAINAIAAGCVPLWPLLFLLEWFFFFGQTLIAIATSNMQVADIVTLYNAARTQVLLMLVGRPPPAIAVAARSRSPSGRVLQYRWTERDLARLRSGVRCSSDVFRDDCYNLLGSVVSLEREWDLFHASNSMPELFHINPSKGLRRPTESHSSGPVII